MGRVWAQVQPVRVGQPQELSRRAAGAGEPVHSVELAVVHYRILDAARFGYRAEVSPIHYLEQMVTIPTTNHCYFAPELY